MILFIDESIGVVSLNWQFFYVMIVWNEAVALQLVSRKYFPTIAMDYTCI